MIVAIRIRGLVGTGKETNHALYVLGLQKKYSCVLIKEEPDRLGMIEKVKDCMSFGQIDKETLKELLIKRGKHPGDKPLKANDIDDNFVNNLIAGKASLKDKNIKSFFRLHPPIGGFRKSTKQLYPNGMLGKNPKINELLRRML